MDIIEAAEEAAKLAWKVPPVWSRAGPGAQLRALRRSLKVSQRHLADDSGVAQSVVSRVEAGRDVRWELLVRLFRSLGHEPLIVPLATSEDAQEQIERENLRRRDRAEAGRLARW